MVSYCHMLHTQRLLSRQGTVNVKGLHTWFWSAIKYSWLRIFLSLSAFPLLFIFSLLRHAEIGLECFLPPRSRMHSMHKQKDYDQKKSTLKCLWWQFNKKKLYSCGNFVHFLCLCSPSMATDRKTKHFLSSHKRCCILDVKTNRREQNNVKS